MGSFPETYNDLFGQDGWIMKVMKEATNNKISLYGKKKRTIPCGTSAGNPERAVKMGPSCPIG